MRFTFLNSSRAGQPSDFARAAPTAEALLLIRQGGQAIRGNRFLRPQPQRDVALFAPLHPHVTPPVRPPSIMKRANVIESPGKRREPEMALVVSFRGMGASAVGGLQGHARTHSGLAICAQNLAAKRALTAGLSPGTGSSQACRQNTHRSGQGKSHRSTSVGLGTSYCKGESRPRAAQVSKRRRLKRTITRCGSIPPKMNWDLRHGLH
jgi:hypothetical protein